MNRRRVKELRVTPENTIGSAESSSGKKRRQGISKIIRSMLFGKGITRRWLRTYFLVVVIMSAIIAVCVLGLARNYYYNSIEQGLLQRSQVTIRYFSSTLNAGVNSGNSEAFHSAAQAFVESFDSRSKMELQILNASGDIIVSSTGFSFENDDPLNDYYRAVQSSGGQGVWSGSNSNGESVMAVTRLISGRSASGGAVRFVVSLSSVNQLLTGIAAVTITVLMILLVIMLLSGSYFINSIVMPVKEITVSANKIAKGDFNIRLQSGAEDEIGRLVSSINSMASELAGSEKIKNDFISGVSHELRTPLTAIKGWGETVLSCGPDDRQLSEKGMEIIIRETDRLSGLVEELLDFSRIQDGRMRMNLRRLDVNREAADTVEMFTERCAAEKRTLTLHTSGAPAMVVADANRLRQVMVNIIDNAIKYTDENGEISVTVAAGSERVTVTVTDNGCGIPAEDLPRVTRRFYKANTRRSGFGIGLAVAEEIMILHQGSIDIRSAEGKGTVVTLRLPEASCFRGEHTEQQTPTE
ncbi:MAG: HAMP domain-containing histidine kinase [Ruminococcaceae bacterium]|nr:HAMP domain-containing histidine kinase [Oscillospiraceae bacterium]